MPKNLVFSFLLILLFPIFSFGQNQTRKEIKGKLLPAKDKMYLETVYVFNKQAGAGILSDSDGNFKLAMRIGDTIAVSAIHVADSELVIEQMHLNDAFITLAVEPSMEYLSEVRLSNRNLTGNLDLDMKRLPITKIITSADLGFPVPANTMTIGERKLNSVTAGPVELLVAALTGELKMIKRRIAIEKRDGKLNHIYNRMPSSFYTNNLNITKENIPHFISFCESEKDLDFFDQIPIDEFVEVLQLYAVKYKETFPERF